MSGWFRAVFHGEPTPRKWLLGLGFFVYFGEFLGAAD
jgi:hypothetical protein